MGCNQSKIKNEEAVARCKERKQYMKESVSSRNAFVTISLGNAACQSNCAAVLTAVRRLGEAARECLEAVKLDPAYARAHKRLASLYLRFGHVENSRRHLCLCGSQKDQSEEQKLLLLEKHLNFYADARKFGDWKRALRESEAAIAVGADFSPQLFGVFKMQLNKVAEKAGGGLKKAIDFCGDHQHEDIGDEA